MSNEIRDRLMSLLQDAGAFDRQQKYVYFDRVWHHPDRLRDCAELVHQYVLGLIRQMSDRVPSDRSKLVILSPDSVRSDFGIIPVSVLVADRLGCRFAVWKELADIKWGTSAIIGTDSHGLVCIVLQDVVRRGSTALRMAQAMKALEWEFLVYVAAVLNNRNEDRDAMAIAEQINSILGQRPEFRYILSTQQLG
jgi:phosphoribosylpyrophosphate synthetase